MTTTALTLLNAPLEARLGQDWFVTDEVDTLCGYHDDSIFPVILWLISELQPGVFTGGGAVRPDPVMPWYA